MAVNLSNRTTGKLGHRACSYGCCGEISKKSSKTSIRRAVRRSEAREFKRELSTI